MKTHCIREYDGEIVYVGSRSQCYAFKTGEQFVTELTEEEQDRVNEDPDWDTCK